MGQSYVAPGEENWEWEHLPDKTTNQNCESTSGSP